MGYSGFLDLLGLLIVDGAELVPRPDFYGSSFGEAHRHILESANDTGHKLVGATLWKAYEPSESLSHLLLYDTDLVGVGVLDESEDEAVLGQQEYLKEVTV